MIRWPISVYQGAPDYLDGVDGARSMYTSREDHGTSGNRVHYLQEHG
jgi:hypothetical protein